MDKDQIILLEDRGLISIIGEDIRNFLQNIIHVPFAHLEHDPVLILRIDEDC